jgi:hypothetical protein
MYFDICSGIIDQLRRARYRLDVFRWRCIVVNIRVNDIFSHDRVCWWTFQYACTLHLDGIFATRLFPSYWTITVHVFSLCRPRPSNFPVPLRLGTGRRFRSRQHLLFEYNTLWVGYLFIFFESRAIHFQRRQLTDW